MTIRDMHSHMLTPLRSFSESGHLVANITFDSTEEALSEFGAIPAGRCLHMTNLTGQNQIPVCKWGCEGNEKIPVFLYRPSDSYSGGYPGPDPTTNMGPTWSTGVERRILGYVGMEGFELATTEFDTSRAYKVGHYLKALELSNNTDADEAQTSAGVLTNNTVRYGADTIVGIVSPGVASPMAKDNVHDEYHNKVLSFYTTYRPPVEGLRNGTPTNLT